MRQPLLQATFASLYRRCSVDVERTAEDVEYDLDPFGGAERRAEQHVDDWRRDA